MFLFEHFQAIYTRGEQVASAKHTHILASGKFDIPGPPSIEQPEPLPGIAATTPSQQPQHVSVPAVIGTVATLTPLDMAWAILFKQENWLNSETFDDYMEQGMAKEDISLLKEEDFESIIQNLKLFPGKRFASVLSNSKLNC